MTTEVLPEGTRALPVAAAQRNTYLHSLLPDFDEHEFPTDNECRDHAGTAEAIARHEMIDTALPVQIASTNAGLDKSRCPCDPIVVLSFHPIGCVEF